MQPTKEQKATILQRILKLSDFSPFVLIVDSLAQSAATLIPEFHHHKPSNVNVVEVLLDHHPGKPSISPDQLVDFVKSRVSGRSLVFIDNLGLLKDVGSILHQIMGPETTVIGVFHSDTVSPPSYTPQGIQLLNYMATSIIELVPQESVEQDLVEDPCFGPFNFKGFNSSLFTVNVTHRRKSGRAITAKFAVDTKSHSYEYLAKQVQENDDEKLLANLTTFNLTTTEKQKLEREKVDLPFLHAQEVGDGGAQGGAIVYHFEKEDDYDEEDPYEDPF